MLCHQLGRLVKIESNTHTKPLLNVSGDLFLLIDAHESAMRRTLSLDRIVAPSVVDMEINKKKHN